MESIYVYHVVTQRPMYIGQQIILDKEHHNSVYERVTDKLSAVKDIYAHPQQYHAEELEHHTRVALRELALEKIRQREYPNYPSRMQCLYVSETFREAWQWAQFFADLGRPTYSIVKLKVTGNYFAGDANNCFDATTNEEENLHLARYYWKNLPNIKGEPPIREILVDGEIQVMEIVEEINRNLP